MLGWHACIDWYTGLGGWVACIELGVGDVAALIVSKNSECVECVQSCAKEVDFLGLVWV